jgi:putative two-component system response regulator
MGLAKKTVETILYSAPMHDIGKIGIPDDILLKAGK